METLAIRGHLANLDLKDHEVLMEQLDRLEQLVLRDLREHLGLRGELASLDQAVRLVPREQLVFKAIEEQLALLGRRDKEVLLEQLDYKVKQDLLDRRDCKVFEVKMDSLVSPAKQVCTAVWREHFLLVRKKGKGSPITSRRS